MLPAPAKRINRQGEVWGRVLILASEVCDRAGSNRYAPPDLRSVQRGVRLIFAMKATRFCIYSALLGIGSALIGLVLGFLIKASSSAIPAILFARRYREHSVST